jgi:branched-chain amino acid aminotransferase
MSVPKNAGKLWLNGVVLEAGDPCLSAADRGATLGDGLFETIAALDGAPLRLSRHLARLRAGAEFLRIPIAFSDADIDAAARSLLRANGLDRAALRLALTRGPAPRGLLPPADPAPTLLLTAGPLPPPVGAPARAIVATVTRRNEFSPLARMKTLSALDYVVARQEAADKGADEAILLNIAGNVAESTIANIFVVLSGRILTPPVSAGALPGVRRAELLDSGFGVAAVVTVDMLAQADEIILCNSLTLRPVIRIGDTAVGAGRSGPVFDELCRLASRMEKP